MQTPLDRVSHTQKERLAYIEFRAYFLGEISRADIIKRFGIATAAATRDLAMYRSISDGNVELDPRSKCYVPVRDFRLIFEHPVDRVLSALSQGFGEGISGQTRPLIPSEIPRPLHYPDVSVFAPITQAIYRKKVVRIAYHSFSSGRSERDIVPFALANNGLRWHVRAFDRKRSQFIDFVLTRVEASELLSGSQVEEGEDASCDIQWSRIVEFRIRRRNTTISYRWTMGCQVIGYSRLESALHLRAISFDSGVLIVLQITALRVRKFACG